MLINHVFLIWHEWRYPHPLDLYLFPIIDKVLILSANLWWLEQSFFNFLTISSRLYQHIFFISLGEKNFLVIVVITHDYEINLFVVKWRIILVKIFHFLDFSGGKLLHLEVFLNYCKEVRNWIFVALYFKTYDIFIKMQELFYLYLIYLFFIIWVIFW
jgi:hypothetical protein